MTFWPPCVYHTCMKNQERLNLITDSLSDALQSFCQFESLQEHLGKLPRGQARALLAIGKDAGRMMDVALKTVSPTAGMALCLTKYGYYQPQDERVTCFEAGHPVPDENTIKHSRTIIDWLQSLPQDMELIVLLSGGGSALFEAPKAPHTLADVIRLNKELLAKGLDIKEMNKVRATFSEVKAGAAAKHFKGKNIRVYALSDVENDDPRVISSGPFTSADVEFHIIGNNFSFRQLLKSALEERGLDVINMQAFESGDAATLISKIRQLFADNAHNPNCPIILSGGEVPIQVTGNGKGGRCTHLALSMAPVLAQYKDALFVAYATDGSDNLSDVAGAWVDAATVNKLKAKGIDIDAALRNSDSYTALNEIGQVLKTGEFHANINDVYIISPCS